jgi:uncharacterized protein YbbC (DUF1343 family)
MLQPWLDCGSLDRIVGRDMAGRSSVRNFIWGILIAVMFTGGCASESSPTRPVVRTAPTAPRAFAPVAPKTAPATVRPTPSSAQRRATAPVVTAPPGKVMLGIDVLQAEGFAVIKGKRIGLLTHAAAVNRHGVSTVEILRRAPGVRLVELFAVEHGFDATAAAERAVDDAVDPATGLRIISLYKGHVVKPTPEQLRPIDVLVVDLQDVGTRSYTFAGAMKLAMEACFENGKTVVVLDRPNPLGGLTVDGPMLDPDLMSDVGRFLVPYVHGMTIGELAQMVRATPPPGGLAVSARARATGRLVVVPMRGWRRSMRWPDTGLRWIPPSPGIQDLGAVAGYPMTGLGCILGGFKHGLGPNREYLFRALYYDGQKKVSDAALERELQRLRLPGLAYRPIAAKAANRGEKATGVYIVITDPNAWRPTALNFHLMKLACAWSPTNPFGAATAAERRTFNVHVGCAAFFNDLVAKGARVDIDAWLRRWRAQDRAFQAQSRRYWLYR